MAFSRKSASVRVKSGQKDGRRLLLVHFTYSDVDLRDYGDIRPEPISKGISKPFDSRFRRNTRVFLKGLSANKLVNYHRFLENPRQFP